MAAKSKKVIETSVNAGDESPVVFISHDSRDADLAEAFATLLTDVSGGIIKSFRSSDHRANEGIEYGAEWHKAIMTKIGEASGVVALLTKRSLDRPWILYESGVAYGKLGSSVLGLALGIPLSEAARGPFAQFQNCADDENSLTKLVLELVKRHPDANPREEAVRRQVRAFADEAKKILATRPKEEISSSLRPVEAEAPSIAKLFEELKIQVKDIPEMVQILRHLQIFMRPNPVEGSVSAATPLSSDAASSTKVVSSGVLRPEGAGLKGRFIINGKPTIVTFSPSWKRKLSELGYPAENDGVMQLINAVVEWVSKNPNSPDRSPARPVNLNQFQFTVARRPNGWLVSNFKDL